MSETRAQALQRLAGFQEYLADSVAEIRERVTAGVPDTAVSAELLQRLAESKPEVKDSRRLISLNPNSDTWPQLASEALYGLAGDFVRMVSPHSEADRAALLFQFHAFFGNVISRKAHFRVEATKHHANIYTVAVGETGKGRKGTSYGHVQRVFEAADPEWAKDCIRSGLTSGEGLIYHVRDAVESQEPIKEDGKVKGYQMVVVDPGITDKQLLGVESEFAQVLRIIGREGNTLSPVMRNGWDTGDMSTLAKNSPVKATGAHISIIGHITKDEVTRYLDRTEAANGFGNRHLWYCVRRSKILPEGGHVPESERVAFVARLQLSIEHARQCGRLEFNEEARDLWHAIYAELSEGHPGLFGAMIARAEAQVVRLALLYALQDLADEIRQEHVVAGLAAWMYAEDSAAYIFGANLGEPLADEILAALRRSSEGMTRTQIRDLGSRNRKGASIERALGLLEENGLARSESRPSEGQGRPAEVWFAEPKSTGLQRGYRSYLSYAPSPLYDESGLQAGSSTTTETTKVLSSKEPPSLLEDSVSERGKAHTTKTTKVGAVPAVPEPTTETTEIASVPSINGPSQPEVRSDGFAVL